jgi:CRP-like cAMP-binding protein
LSPGLHDMPTLPPFLEPLHLLGVTAAGLAFTSDLMKNMVPLRCIALLANLLYVIYYGITQEFEYLLLHALLLPVNAKRLWDILKLVRDLKRVDADTPVTEWLIQHMHKRRFTAGDVLFRRGDHAHEMVYVASGLLSVQGSAQTFGVGALLGEIGLFSPKRQRTQTVVCQSDGELFYMTDDMMYRLYHQNPKLGFYLMRLIVQRLLGDIEQHHGQQGASVDMPAARASCTSP